MELSSTSLVANAPAGGFLDKLDAWCSRLSAWLAGVGIAIMLLLAGLTIFEVLLRSFFGFPIPGMNEIADGAMPIAIAATLAVGISGKANLCLEFVQKGVHAPVRQWLSVLSSAAMLAFFSILAWQFALMSIVSAERNQITNILRIPQAPIQSIVTALLLVATAIQLVKVVLALRAALKAEKEAFNFRRFAPLLITILLAGVGALLYFMEGASGDMAYVIPTLVVICVVLIFLSVPISAALAFTGMVGVALTLGPGSSFSLFGAESYAYLSNSGLAVLPFFLLMGAFAGISGVASDIYRLAFELFKPVRGGLAHATIIGCAGFGALTGSSLATVATFGKIALPEMEKRNFSSALASGTIAAGGTLGALVPPSVPLIIYGILVEASIGKLLVASFIPAFLGIALYLVTISIYVRVRKDSAPLTDSINWAVVRSAAKGSWVALTLFGIVWGGIYFGLFTDTEAASVGATGTFIIALIRGRLGRETVLDAMREVTLTLAMIFPLIFGAAIFSFFVAFAQIPDIFSTALLSANFSPFTIVLLLVLSYLLMGMVMDSFAIMFITAPIYAFIIAQLGYDPIWWGIITIVCVEIGVISPPFGLNLFVLKSMTPHIGLKTMYVGVSPFVAADLVKIGLLLFLPWLVVH